MRPPVRSALRNVSARILSWPALLAIAAPAALAAADSTALEQVVRLPEFRVFEQQPLPPRESWDYVKVGGLEILSNASAGTTKEFTRDLGRFLNMLQVAAPTMLIRAEQPVMIVLCGKGGQYERFMRDASGPARRVTNVGFVRDVEIASIIVDYENKTVNVPGADVLSTGPNGELRPLAATTLAGDRPARTMAEFSRQYVLLSLSEMKPRLPAWAAEGLAAVYGAIEYGDKWIEIGSPRLFARQIEERIVTPDIVPELTALQNRAGWGGTQASEEYGTGVMPATVYAIERAMALLSMEQLFAVGYDSPVRGGTAPDGAFAGYQWRQQCAAFVHLCLYGANGKFRSAFIKFASQTSTEPPTDAFFKECFGLDYGAMALRIRAHWTDLNFKGLRIEATDGKSLVGSSAQPVIRPATDAEIGRIKGETFRLTGQEEPARREFVTAYLRGERDLQLLASLGLMARQRRDETRAYTYLEAVGAAAEPVPRPRAYLELARMRADAMQKGADLPRYNREAVAALLTPLFRAQRLPQQLSLIYREIAKVWAHSAVPPDREHLAAIEHGARLFPYDAELATELAELLAAHGHRADAQHYVNRALKLTRDSGLRARLQKVLGEN
ncbi:MAG: hypothetical protein JNK23_01780 [Opitutaceae bacterium]|nr:hypothetical protein [Opitutaceae bacterium]